MTGNVRPKISQICETLPKGQVQVDTAEYDEGSGMQMDADTCYALVMQKLQMFNFAPELKDRST